MSIYYHLPPTCEQQLTTTISINVLMFATRRDPTFQHLRNFLTLAPIWPLQSRRQRSRSPLSCRSSPSDLTKQREEHCLSQDCSLRRSSCEGKSHSQIFVMNPQFHTKPSVYRWMRLFLDIVPQGALRTPVRVKGFLVRTMQPRNCRNSPLPSNLEPIKFLARRRHADGPDLDVCIGNVLDCLWLLPGHNEQYGDRERKSTTTE